MVPEFVTVASEIARIVLTLAPSARIVPELLTVTLFASMALPTIDSISPVLAVTLIAVPLMAKSLALIMPVVVPLPTLATVAVPAAWIAMPPAAAAVIVPVLPMTFWLTLTSPLFETTANIPVLVTEPVLSSVNRPLVTIAMLLA